MNKQVFTYKVCEVSDIQLATILAVFCGGSWRPGCGGCAWSGAQYEGREGCGGDCVWEEGGRGEAGCRGQLGVSPCCVHRVTHPTLGKHKYHCHSCLFYIVSKT